MDSEPWDAIVLAGGTARRLGGRAKPQETVGGVRLLDRVVTAASGAGTVVVVGPWQPVCAPPSAALRWVRETPAGGGPVAALAAGLPLTGAGRVMVLAADLPWIAPALPLLLAAAGPAVAVLVDPGGRRNPLAATWPRPVLVEALARAGPPAGAAMRTLLDGIDLVEVPDGDGWGLDCDTWADLAAARARAAAVPRRPAPGASTPDPSTPDPSTPHTAAPHTTAPHTAASETASASEKGVAVTNPLDHWLATLCAEFDLDPGVVDRDLLLDLARDAAHGVARPAAPLTTFVVGLVAGRDGGSPEALQRACAAAARLALAHGRQSENVPQTDNAQSETAQSETAQSETAQSETAQSETAQSETAQSETAQSETAQGTDEPGAG